MVTKMANEGYFGRDATIFFSRVPLSLRKMYHYFPHDRHTEYI